MMLMSYFDDDDDARIFPDFLGHTNPSSNHYHNRRSVFKVLRCPICIFLGHSISYPQVMLLSMPSFQISLVYLASLRLWVANLHLFRKSEFGHSLNVQRQIHCYVICNRTHRIHNVSYPFGLLSFATGLQICIQLL